MSIPFIDLKLQYQAIKPEIDACIHTVLDHGQYIMGPEVKELEERLQDYTEVKHCITVASGTEALLISLMALDIGLGDEVITTPFTFAATAEVIVNVGATPVFVDIQSSTYNINPEKIEQAITPNTKAILPVSLYGQTADMDEINAIAIKYGNIHVIEDAAQSFGATYKGNKSCNLSTVGCTSFFPSKPLGCYGDGGAIFTDDDSIAQACREIRVHGQSKRYVHTRVGVGGRMDTIQAAVVLVKLDHFDEEVRQRHVNGERYLRLITDKCKLVSPPTIMTDRTSVYGQYTILTSDREMLQNHLKEVGIPTAIHYPIPLNEQEAYQAYKQHETPVAHDIARQVMSLPMYPGLTSEEQKVIVDRMSTAECGI
jgi:UDP-2-acetamido-2-deoxy-ribo-hexuluronate aminotransferase